VQDDPGTGAAGAPSPLAPDVPDTAPEFRTEATELHGEAAHLRSEADELQQIGLKGNAEDLRESAEGLDRQAADFDRRARMLEEADKLDKEVLHERKLAHDAWEQMVESGTDWSEADEALKKPGLSDERKTDLEVEAGREWGEAKAYEKRWKELEGEASFDAAMAARERELALTGIGDPPADPLPPEVIAPLEQDADPAGQE
jgi:hypothetical protein